MKIEEIRLAKSALCDTVYAGRISKDGKGWLSKKDVTADFARCVVDMYCGYKAEFSLGDKKYRVVVEEVKE